METNKRTLADIKKDVPFKVPENYFTQFNETIMAKLPEKVIEPVKPISLWDKSKVWVYMAAMFLGLIFTMKVFVVTTDTTNPTKKNTASTTISQQDNWNDVKISEDDFFNYIETQFEDESYYNLVYDQAYLDSL